MARRDRNTGRRSAANSESNNNFATDDSTTERQETYKTYRVKFKITRSLSSYTEPNDYICKISGEIICTDEAGNDSVAGTVHAYRIQVDRIINDGESLFDACDAHSQTVHNYSCVLFDFHRGGLKRAIERQFDLVGAGDILILDKIEVLPPHRGRGLGLAAACSFLDTFENGCCLVVGEPTRCNSRRERVNTPNGVQGWVQTHSWLMKNVQPLNCGPIGAVLDSKKFVAVRNLHFPSNTAASPSVSSFRSFE